jgi:glycosyltransferase involved in cell wall biosynthesis
MRIYYVSSGLAGCYLVRSLLPLQANGWDGDITSITFTQKTPENKGLAAINSDIVVFHRPESPDKLKLARHLKTLGKKIVYDNDDTYMDENSVKLNAYMTEERVKLGLHKISEQANLFIKEADLVTCSTQQLAEEYRHINPNVKILPNCIDPFLFDEPLRNEGDKVRIGITGSVGLTSDLDVLFPIFKHYENDPRVQLVFFSLNDKPTKLLKEIYQGEYAILESMKNLEWVPLVPLEEYYETLNNLRLDFQIIPRQDNYFNRCKSNIKFLESSMLEIPCIAQGFSTGDSPYQVNPEDSKYLILAQTPEEWIERIEELIADKDKRREMGRKAREYVEENYDINKKAHLWEDAYRELL